MEFKDMLKTVRIENNVSAYNLAKQLNKSESAIRMWESGKTKPDADTLMKLSKIFDCSTDYLLGLSVFKNTDELRNVSEQNEISFKSLLKMPSEDRADALSALDSVIGGYEDLKSIPNLQSIYLQLLTTLTFDLSYVAQFPLIASELNKDNKLYYLLLALSDGRNQSILSIQQYYREVEKEVINEAKKEPKEGTVDYTNIKAFLAELKKKDE